MGLLGRGLGGLIGSIAIATGVSATFSIPTTTLTIPLISGQLYDMTVAWGDGSSDVYNSSALTSISKTYASAGTKNVTITGAAFGGVRYNNGTEKLTLLAIGAYSYSAAAMAGAYWGCSGLTSFPAINTAAAINFTQAWQQCTGLTSFPLLNTAAGTNFTQAWRLCTGLTSFPLLNTAAVANFTQAWFACAGLTSFPLINTASATTLISTWFGCTGLTSFPAINTASVANFSNAWQQCTGLTSFPLLNTASAVAFSSAWQGCTNLVNFPANMFNSAPAINFTNAFLDCNLSQQSVDNILISINSRGLSNGTLTLSGGTSSAPSSTGQAAKDALLSRGWAVTTN